MSDLHIRDNLKVVYFMRHGSTSPFFALREFDTKILRTPVNREKGSLRVQGVSEQAIRARITQVIMKLKLLPVKGLKSEVKVLKQRGILGKRAPKCSLLIADDMVNLLRAFGRESHANDLDEAIKRLKKKTSKKTDLPETQTTTPKMNNSALRPRKECTVKRSLNFVTSAKRIQAYPSFNDTETPSKRIKVSNLMWSNGSIGSPTRPSPYCGFQKPFSWKRSNIKGYNDLELESVDSTIGETPGDSSVGSFTPLFFNSPSPPPPLFSLPRGENFPPKRQQPKGRFPPLNPLKSSCRMDLFSSPPTRSALVNSGYSNLQKLGDEELNSLPVWEGMTSFPFTKEHKNNRINLIKAKNNLKLSIPPKSTTELSSTPPLAQPFPLSPPPMIPFHFDVSSAVTEIINGLENVPITPDTNNALPSPLYFNTPIDVAHLSVGEDDDDSDQELQSLEFSKSNVPPTPITAETDAYLAICQSLQPIAQIS